MLANVLLVVIDEKGVDVTAVAAFAKLKFPVNYVS